MLLFNFKVRSVFPTATQLLLLVILNLKSSSSYSTVTVVATGYRLQKAAFAYCSVHCSSRSRPPPPPIARALATHYGQADANMVDSSSWLEKYSTEGNRRESDTTAVERVWNRVNNHGTACVSIALFCATVYSFHKGYVRRAFKIIWEGDKDRNKRNRQLRVGTHDDTMILNTGTAVLYLSCGVRFTDYHL